MHHQRCRRAVPNATGPIRTFVRHEEACSPSVGRASGLGRRDCRRGGGMPWGARQWGMCGCEERCAGAFVFECPAALELARRDRSLADLGRHTVATIDAPPRARVRGARRRLLREEFGYADVVNFQQTAGRIFAAKNMDVLRTPSRNPWQQRPRDPRGLGGGPGLLRGAFEPSTGADAGPIFRPPLSDQVGAARDP